MDVHQVYPDKKFYDVYWSDGIVSRQVSEDTIASWLKESALKPYTIKKKVRVR